MKKTLLISCAAALIVALPAAGFAQTSSGTSNANGASQYAPGQQDRSNMTGPGASDAAPGQTMQNDTTGSVKSPGVSGYSPGQKMLQKDSSGSSTQSK
ncbi:hypothetical protein [Microvirga massiliensis]|uniref:hypothetical protein n=1 Tax=Microvirga massiliensis TaxID=1033741 RepID=UPI00062B6F5A|nr:hypothetical protein [Microvirga massiliensis]